MGELIRFVPLLLLGGALGVALFSWAAGRIARNLRPRREGSDETAFLLRTVHDVVSGIRESESDLRDLYSRAERRASFLDRYHRSILESMKTGVVACNRRGEVTAMNGAATRTLGVSAEKARGRRLGDLVGPDHLFARVLRAAIRGEPVDDRLELRIDRADGGPRWVELRTSVLYGKSGQPVGATFLVDDVTEAKILRRRVELRERLATMGEISAGIAHEFRNALHALSGLGRLIARRAAGDDRIEPLAREILGETTRMETVLRELRTFVKPHASRLERLDPVELIRSVLLPFVENQPEKPIRFRLDAGPDLSAVRADRALLSRALRNLVQNAVHAMAGGGTLTVRARFLGRGGDAPQLAISVRDTGPGIAPDLEKRIFTPFFTTRPEGTGLGLPIVQKAVAAHGGSLEVESTVGRGATFTILLPAGEEAVESNGGACAVAAPRSGRSSR